MVASKVAFFGLCRRDCMKLRSGLRLLYIGARIKSSSDKAEFPRNRGAICTFTRRGRCMQVRRLSAREGPISIKDTLARLANRESNNSKANRPPTTMHVATQELTGVILVCPSGYLAVPIPRSLELRATTT